MKDIIFLLLSIVTVIVVCIVAMFVLYPVLLEAAIYAGIEVGARL